jgi:integrase
MPADSDWADDRAVNCTGLPLAGVHDLVSRYLLAARAQNTRKAYSADLRDFEAWGGSIPSRPDEIACYIAARAQTLSPSTLRRRLAGLATLHHDKGAPDPTKDPLVCRVMRGIERTHGHPPRQARPLCLSDLARIMSTIDDTPRGRRDRAILLAGFFGGLRRSELVGLDLSDLSFSDLGACLAIQRSKTDQTGMGRTVLLPRRPDALCPVSALLAWEAVRGEQPGKLFFRMDQACIMTLHPGTVSEIVRSRAFAAGLKATSISSHSLRAGLVTSAMTAGRDGALIARQTGHRSQQSLSIYARPLVGLALPSGPVRPA